MGLTSPGYAASMDLSVSLAMTMATTPASRRNSSLRKAASNEELDRVLSLYKGISDRPVGWKKTKRLSHLSALIEAARDMDISRWDGHARTSTAWDALRRDPELFFPRGNCLVYLYAQCQSNRGPAFKIPMETLLAANCRPLLQRFLSQAPSSSPLSDSSSDDILQDSGQLLSGTYELYIPAPPATDRRQAFLYHIATRNFFAWICGKPLVGTHLGAALVGLLNSMAEFRSTGEDNIQAIIDFMDEEGYADMRDQPTNALAVLFFAEHFQFRDLWIDAFAHCAGMNDRLYNSPGFDTISRTSRALITRARLEMDIRLDHYGKVLSTFLLDDFSDAHLGLRPSARAHMDKFSSFLQSYYIRTLGYYPPAAMDTQSSAFPKNVYKQMRTEFQKLYDYLVDSEFTSSDCIPSAAQGGICVLQSVKAFDSRHKHTSFKHPLPLLPKIQEQPSKASLSRRMSWVAKPEKMKLDGRLSTLSALIKATNAENETLSTCNLVRAYKQFEKDYVISPSNDDGFIKGDDLSQTDARKVRWILIYGMLQTLISATKVPDEVRDHENVQYNLCVVTAGCPPWKVESPSSTLLRTQLEQARDDFRAFTSSEESSVDFNLIGGERPRIEIKPDVDHYTLNYRSQPISSDTALPMPLFPLKNGSIRKARSTLGNMPELVHPRPHRNTHHEILVYGYGNGLNQVTVASKASPQQDHAPLFEPQKDKAIPATPPAGEDRQRKMSADSSASSLEERTSRWSHSTIDSLPVMDSPVTTYSSHSRRGSDISVMSKNDITSFLDSPISALGFVECSREELRGEYLQPDPLRVVRHAGV